MLKDFTITFIITLLLQIPVYVYYTSINKPPEIQESKTKKELLIETNQNVNNYLIYKKDIEVHGVTDYWQTPAESLQLKSGDCEDYAILKMSVLLDQGIPYRDMMFTLVRLDPQADTLDHMFLSVLINNKIWVLDNNYDELRELKHYTIGAHITLDAFLDADGNVVELDPSKYEKLTKAIQSLREQVVLLGGHLILGQ